MLAGDPGVPLLPANAGKTQASSSSVARVQQSYTPWKSPMGIGKRICWPGTAAQQARPEQKAYGLNVWAQPMVQLRLPMLFNMRSDPFERSQREAGDYVKWFVEHAFVLVPAQSVVAQHLASYQQFPPRQKPGSFSIEQVMEKLRNPPSSN
jgi:hypothetical protein